MGCSCFGAYLLKLHLYCAAAVPQAGAALQAEHDALRTAPAPLLAAQFKRSEHLSDQDKFGKLLDNLVAVKGSLQRKLAERSADLSAKREQLAAVTRVGGV
jgi:hypothetical protein